MSGTAKIFTREELRKAICYWADHIATISLNPNTPEACADFVYDEYGIETDISLLEETE